jgi:hypothetical protein
MLELAHQHSTTATSVRLLTVFDVVASTSMQLGLLAAGVLISASVTTSWPIDPYQLSMPVLPALRPVALVPLGRATTTRRAVAG